VETGFRRGRPHPGASGALAASGQRAPLPHARAVLLEQGTEHGTVTSRLLRAIAADREARVVREGGEEVEDAGALRFLHLGAILP
jgi:hypothetical protein